MSNKWTKDTEAQYDLLVDKMVIKPSWLLKANRVAKDIELHQDKYKIVADQLGGSMPWQVIGIIHNLECGMDFKKHLHNGDSLNARTRRVPAGRPLKGKAPFTFTESAVDALQMKGFHNIKEWSPGRVAYELERYNGFGYRNKGRLSPYLWSGTNHYTKGKYVSDGKYDPNVVSQQIGAMVLYQTLMKKEEQKDITQATKDSRRLSFTDNVKKFITWAGIPGFVTLSSFQDVKTFASDHAGWIILGLGITTWMVLKYIEYMSVRELKQKRYKPSGATKTETK